LAEKNTTLWWEAPYDDNWTIGSLLSAQLKLYGSRPVLIAENGDITTRQQLSDQADVIRAQIVAHAATGSSIATLLSLDEHYLASIYAIFTSDNIYTTLDPEAPAARNNKVLETTATQLLFFNKQHQAKALELASINPKLTIINIETLTKDKITTLPNVKTDPQSIAAYLSTSGSSGTPKIVVRNHNSCIHAAYVLGSVFKYSYDDITLATGSTAHVGTLNDVLLALLSGITYIFLPIADLSISNLVQLIIRHRITTCSLSPAVLSLLLPELKNVNCNHLHQILVSGAPLPKNTLSNFVAAFNNKVDLLQNYGSTEAGPIISSRYCGEQITSQASLPLWTKAHGVNIDIVGSNNQSVPSGLSGEIIVRSQYMANGYFEANANASFGIKNDTPFFKTGDYGQLDEDGSLYIGGRSDRQFSIYGRRYELGELENAIQSNIHWNEAVALYKPNDEKPPLLTVAIQASKDNNQTTDELRSYLASQLPAALIPNQFVIVNQFPKTSSGKINYSAIKTIIENQINVSPKGLGGKPQGSLENWIADCWENLFSISRPGRRDNFLELGGDSLIATQLILMLEQRFGISLKLDQLAQALTIEQQAKLVSIDKTRLENKVLIPIRSDDAGPICVFIPGKGGHAWVFNNLITELSTPVTAYSISFEALFDRLATLPKTTEDINNILYDEIMQLPIDRDLLICGYSMGSIIATSICEKLVTHGRDVSRLILLDPQKSGARNGIALHIRNYKNSIKQYITREVTQSKMQLHLEKNVKKQATILRSLYKHFNSFVIEPQPTSIMQTEQGKATFSLENYSKVTDLRIDNMKCDHLDCVRYPNVIKTAQWLDQEIRHDMRYINQ
jgi:acyl-coenzyme A synthetase/AMP-(fatty) acid ligase/thioesterase domain-containing protein/acyl carrier protein